MADHPVVEVAGRVGLRDWLAANHATSGTVWLSLAKKPDPDHIPYDQVVQELLCWGWIDSLPRALDDRRSLLRAAPRSPRSAWSAVNKAHVAAMRAAGLMTPTGEAKVAAAVANGKWDFLNDVENLTMPDDLAAALSAAGATATWDAFPRSVKRGSLEQVAQAKAPATRAARVAEIAGSAARGLRAGWFRRGKK